MESKEEINYLASKLLSGVGDVECAFLGSGGGVSGGAYATLNLSYNVGDDPDSVEMNLRRVVKAFDLLDSPILTSQVHGKKVVVAASLSDATVEADAIITNRTELPIGVLTADCLPIVLFDPVKKAIGAIHAGWRGTAVGVASETVRALTENYGSKPQDIIAVMGPCIWPCCYHIKDDVVEAFSGSFEGARECILTEDGVKRLDLRKANLTQLKACGLSEANIETHFVCTSCEDTKFFSYRKEGPDTGRQLSFIILRS